MSEPARKTSRARRFKVGELVAVPQLNQLRGASEEHTVEARSMDVLVALAEHGGDVLSRDELLEMVWGERFVGEEALTHAIWDLRRALGDDPKTPRFIQTVRGQGYRLVAKVSWLEDGVGEQARYVLGEEIGRGAMGVVFRAEDPRLDRTVAVKFLPSALCRDRDSKARFLREARSAARLDHPNICAVYEVDETDDGRMYLVMPLYEGETLRERIGSGPLPWPEAVRIAAEIADGLEGAHRAGIVHRDLKPGNVMLPPAASADESDQKASGVRILDFGLAKLRGTTQLTLAGSSLGTPSYMSPELAGRENAGPESDLWALGVLLYEMLAGQTPFRGANAQAVIYSIINSEPEPLSPDLEVPPELKELLDSLLVKNPSDRISDAGELAVALRRLLTEDLNPTPGATALRPVRNSAVSRRRPGGMWIGLAAAAIVVVGLAFFIGRTGQTPKPGSITESAIAPDDRSIAVLAFTDMSPSKDQEYFSDGISEELLNLLAGIPDLRVTSRSSAFSFKGKNLEIPEISRRLNVAYILEGSVRKDGNQVRITVQLIDADTDTHLWSNAYNRTLEDIFAVQDEIAADVVAQLKVSLLTYPSAVRDVDPEAYTLTLKARHLNRLETKEGFINAIEYSQRALLLDPGSVAAWVEVAHAYIRQADHGERPYDEGYRLARDAAGEALAIDPDCARAHVQLGWIAKNEDRDLAAAAGHFQRALSLEPNNAEVLGSAAHLANSLGRVDEAVAIREYLDVRDPANTYINRGMGQTYYFARRFDEAVESYTGALKLNPNSIRTNAFLGMALLAEGKTDEALQAAMREPDRAEAMQVLIPIYHALGRDAESDAGLAELVELHADTSAYNIAYGLAYRGEADRAFEWLANAAECHDTGLAYVVVEPLFDTLHSDPRWLPFLRSIGKAPEQLAAIEFNVTLPE